MFSNIPISIEKGQKIKNKMLKTNGAQFETISIAIVIYPINLKDLEGSTKDYLYLMHLIKLN